MKNFELKFWLSCLVMALCIGFASCSDDDDEGIAGDAKTLIVGTWEATWSKGYEIYEGEKETWNEPFDDEIYTFKEDGTGTYEEVGYTADTFTWSISGNKLTITDKYDSEVITIKTLNSTTAVIVTQYKDDEEEYYEEITLKKR